MENNEEIQNESNIPMQPPPPDVLLRFIHKSVDEVVETTKQESYILGIKDACRSILSTIEDSKKENKSSDEIIEELLDILDPEE